MKSWLARNFSTLQWTVGIGISLLAVLAWVVNRDIGQGSLTALVIAPVLGLIAYGLMWSHYTFGSLRRWLGVESRRDIYWRVSSAAVLALIIMHPVLISYSLISAGFGLPPANYVAAYGERDAVFVTLGMFALVVFLLFELHRWYRDRSWWKWVERLQIVAMIAIFVHGTSLGGETARGWYVWLWWVLGLTLLAAWVYNWYYGRGK